MARWSVENKRNLSVQLWENISGPSCGWWRGVWAELTALDGSIRPEGSTTSFWSWLVLWGSLHRWESTFRMILRSCNSYMILLIHFYNCEILQELYDYGILQKLYDCYRVIQWDPTDHDPKILRCRGEVGTDSCPLYSRGCHTTKAGPCEVGRPRPQPGARGEQNIFMIISQIFS